MVDFCCSLLAVLVHVPSTGVNLNKRFSCWGRMLHVSLPPHPLAMLVVPPPKRHIERTAYLEIGILQPCSVRHSQYLVIYYTVRERRALRSSLTPKCNMFCDNYTVCLPENKPNNQGVGAFKNPGFRVWQKTGKPGNWKRGSANSIHNGNVT